MRRWWIALVALAAGCGADDNDLRVMVASSLADAVDEIARVGDVDIEVVVSGSSSLVAQLDAGADADLLVTADEPTMQRAVELGLVDSPRPIATNELIVAVPPGNPADVASVDALADDSLVVATCAPSVPCGALLARAATALDLRVRADSEEPNVRAVVRRLENGEADVGVVYRTDVRHGRIEAVPAPELAGFSNRGQVAATNEADEAALVLVDLITGDTGRAILTERGFGRVS